jgi:predicted DNA-binding ribbon-helix-helix protein
VLVKRSISIEGHRTSIALEPEFWAEVERLAALAGQNLAAFVASVDEARGNANLASALRVAVLQGLKAGWKAERSDPA